MMVQRFANRGGFTLIEIMVAMTILTGLVAGIYACFAGVASSAEIARSATEELRIQQYLRAHFEQHLRAVHANVRAEYAFVGEDGSGAYGDADTLTFTTTLPTSGAKSLPGIVKTVTYEIDDPSLDGDSGFQTFDQDVPEDEEKPSVMLYITESPLVLGEENEDEAFFEDDEDNPWQREIPIRSLNFEYYDGAAEEWIEEWNSDELGFLPWAVRVSVNLAKTEEQLRADLAEGVGTEENPDLSLTLVIPTGAGILTADFIDPNHQRYTENVDGGSDIFEDGPQ
jgi:prepilin-type N-terminal cleavage/methylation domain-containing protein